MHRCRPAPSGMISGDVFSIGSPDRLIVAPLAEESRPDHEIAAIGTEAVWRTHPHGGAGTKEPIEIGVVAPIIIQDKGRALAQTSPLRRRDRGGGEGWQSTMRHHRRPAKSGQFGEIELRDENPLCGGSRTGGLKPASARTTTSPCRPNQSLTPRNVALKHNARETRPYSSGRQKAALVVMGVEQRELLMAVHPVAGIVDVERDRGRRAPVAFAEPIHQRGHQSGDLDLRRRILQPRHRGLRTQRIAALRRVASFDIPASENLHITGRQLLRLRVYPSNHAGCVDKDCVAQTFDGICIVCGLIYRL